jgi:hypothetical protein
MKTKENEAVDSVLSAAAALQLWIEDRLEPDTQKVVEDNLDTLYALCVAAERKARSTYPDW